jgi:hypothetical protein
VARAKAGHGTIKTVLWHNGKWGLFPGGGWGESGRVMKLTTHHQLKSGFRMSGTKNGLPYAFKACRETIWTKYNFKFSPHLISLYFTLLVFRITENMEKVQNKTFSKCHLSVTIYKTLMASWRWNHEGKMASLTKSGLWHSSTKKTKLILIRTKPIPPHLHCFGNLGVDWKIKKVKFERNIFPSPSLSTMLRTFIAYGSAMNAFLNSALRHRQMFGDTVILTSHK